MLIALVAAVVSAAPARTLEQDFPKATLSVRAGQSTVSMVIGLDAQVPRGPEGALLFLQRYAGAFGIGPEDALVFRSQRGDSEATYVRFDRVKSGVPIIDAEVVVTFDAAGRLTMVHAGAQVPPAHGAFVLPSPRRGAVQRWLRTTQRDGERVVDVLRPAWVSTERLEKGTLWRASDAETGVELGRKLIRWTANGKVFDFSPVRDASQLCPVGATDGGYTNCAQTVTRPFGNLTSLQNSRVVARNCEGNGQSTSCVPRAVPNASGDFDEPTGNPNSNTDRFGEVMAWYHADRFSQWLDATSPPFLAGGGLGTVDVFTNVGNYEGAFFDEGGTFGRFAVRVGQGPVADWAYDADVLCHELGHGVVARTSNFSFYVNDAMGIEGDPGSLNEGSADCLSLSFKGFPQLGEFVGSRLHEDSADGPSQPFLRTQSTKKMCQITSIDGTTLATGGRAGEIHADGLIWGSFFWAMRTRLASVSTSGKCPSCTAADVIILRALEALGSGASFNDATLALQQVAASQFGASEAQLVGCMSCEWNMPSCDGRLRFIYPGETHEALLVDSGAGSYGGRTPATFQYALDVPANTTVNFNRFAIDTGTLTLVARFGSPISWSGSSSTATNTITAQGQTLPPQSTAGRWYIQGVHDGADIRRFGFRVNFNPAGNTTTRPAPSGVTCSLGSGIPSGCMCTPQCAGKQCGSDGCGGSCGTCMSGQSCSATSQCNCQPQCAGKQCGNDGCGGVCGTCMGGQMCTPGGTCACTPSCAGRTCGSDGCGGTCGSCAATEFCNTAGACEMGSNPCAGKSCGPDGQGGSCGSCAAGRMCNASGQCVVQAGPCAGLQCGPDGRGGSCGECGANEECNAAGMCAPVVDGCGVRLCGDDGFGGSCGTCGDAEECSPQGTCVKSMSVNGGCGCTSAPIGLLLGLLFFRRRQG
ncbi:MAG: hypothetical protein QM817_28560 [Archangium sp.]